MWQLLTSEGRHIDHEKIVSSELIHGFSGASLESIVAVVVNRILRFFATWKLDIFRVLRQGSESTAHGGENDQKATQWIGHIGLGGLCCLPVLWSLNSDADIQHCAMILINSCTEKCHVNTVAAFTSLIGLFPWLYEPIWPFIVPFMSLLLQLFGTEEKWKRWPIFVTGLSSNDNPCWQLFKPLWNSLLLDWVSKISQAYQDNLVACIVGSKQGHHCSFPQGRTSSVFVSRPKFEVSLFCLFVCFCLQALQR